MVTRLKVRTWKLLPNPCALQLTPVTGSVKEKIMRPMRLEKLSVKFLYGPTRAKS